MPSTPLQSELERRAAEPSLPPPRRTLPSVQELPHQSGWTPQAVGALVLAVLGALSGIITPIVTRVDPPALTPYAKRTELQAYEDELTAARRQAGNAAAAANAAESQLRAALERIDALESTCVRKPRRVTEP